MLDGCQRSARRATQRRAQSSRALPKDDNENDGAKP